MKHVDAIKLFRVPDDKKIKLKDYDPDWAGTEEMKILEADEVKERAEKYLEKAQERLADAQEVLYAHDVHSVLIVLQAMDAAGKDGVIKHVMSGVNPAGCQVYSFKKPSDEELDHNFLWRYWKSLPERGRIGIFNRSYYEEVLVVKVHPEILKRQKLPDSDPSDKLWERRYDDINRFERHLARNGTLVIKFFLHVGKGEQKRRFLDRLNDPEKHWKFSEADVTERGFWSDYQNAFEDMLNNTSTKWAPWYVIPSNHKHIQRALVAEILTKSIEGLGLKPPEVTDERRKRLMGIKKQLERE